MINNCKYYKDKECNLYIYPTSCIKDMGFECRHFELPIAATACEHKIGSVCFYCRVKCPYNKDNEQTCVSYKCRQ